MSNARRVLLVDDLLPVRRSLALLFTVLGWESVMADSGSEGLERLTAGEFDLVILDLNMPGKNGLDVLVEMRLSHPEKPKIFILSGYIDPQARAQALQSGAQCVLEKPIGLAEIQQALDAHGLNLIS